MQDVGGKEDTELSREDSTFRSRELSVESLGHCQSIGNRMGTSARFLPHELGALCDFQPSEDLREAEFPMGDGIHHEIRRPPRGRRVDQVRS